MHKIKMITAFTMLLCALFFVSILGTSRAADDLTLLPLARVSSPKTDAAEPSLAAAPDGSIYVAWVEHLEGGAADLFVQKFDKAKNPLGNKVRINPQAGQATAWRGDPPTLAVSGDQTIYVGWTARVKAGDGRANDLYLSISRDSGQTFGAPVKINDDIVPADRGMHSLAIGDKNDVYVVWLDERYLKHNHQTKSEAKSGTAGQKLHDKHMEANREVYMAVSTNGGKSFAPNKRLAADACPCCKTSVASGPDGKVYVSWRQVLPDNFRHVAVAVSSDRGSTFLPMTIVSDDRWQLEGCPVTGAALAVGSDNALKVAWYSAGSAGKKGLYWAESKDGGKTFSARELLYEGILAGTPVLLGDAIKGYKIVWQSSGKIWQLSTQLNSNNNYKIEEIGTGKLPSAAVANEKLFVGFIKTDEDERSIWLY